MITAEIYAKESRNVMGLYAPNAFIQNKIPHKEKGKRIFMKITGALVDKRMQMDQ